MATPSARAGLFALLNSIDVGAGDEVLVTGYTCEAVPEPIKLLGARPVYVDISARNYAMNPRAAAAAITPRTRAMIVQHTYGIPADLDELLELAGKHKLFVIEDCALALGSRLDGRWLGTRGDAAIWSFELSKTLTAGWGGMVQVNRDAQLASRVDGFLQAQGSLSRVAASRRLMQAGLSGFLYRPELISHTGYLLAALFQLGVFRKSANHALEKPPSDYLAAPDDRQWVVLEREFARLEVILEASRRIAARYQGVLDKHHCGVLLSGSEYAGVRLLRFPLQVLDRRRFITAFADVGIEVGQWFNAPVSCAFETPEHFGYSPGECLIAERLAKHIVNLPLHGRMSDRDVDLAAGCLDRYLDRHPDERAFVAAALKEASHEKGAAGV